jgi:hypothetical protein
LLEVLSFYRSWQGVQRQVLEKPVRLIELNTIYITGKAVNICS